MLKGIGAAWAPAEPKIPISSSRAVIALSLCLSVSCSAHTFVNKLKLQRGEKKKWIEGNVKLNKAPLSTDLADSFHELAEAPLAQSWLVLQLCRLPSDAPR